MSLFQSSMFQSAAETTEVPEEAAVDADEGDQDQDESVDDGHVDKDETVQFHSLSTTPFDVERNCTDWWCLLITLMVSTGAFFLARDLHIHSDTVVLRHGYGYQRLVCPYEESPLDLRPPSERTYAFWCMNATRTGLVMDEPLCVQKCPISDYTFHLCDGGQVHRQDYPTVATNFYCMPLDSKPRKEVQMAFASRRGPLLRLFGVVIREWFLFAIAGCIACIVGYLYMISLFFDAEVVVNRTLSLLTFLPLGTGLYLLITSLEPFQGGAMDVYSYVDSEDSEDKEQQKLAIGCVLSAIGALMWCVTSSESHRDTVHRAAACMEAAGDCMTEEWSILVVPLLAIMVEVCIMVGAFYFTSCVAAQIQAKQLKMRLFDKTYGTSFTNVSDSNFLNFGVQDCSKVVFVILFSYWLNEVVVCASQCVVAFISATWYFAREDSRPGILVQAYALVLVYHLGTICFGSFLRAFGRLPAHVVGVLKLRGFVTPGSLLDQFYFIVLGDGRVFAYVDLGFRSEGYIQAAFKASKILADELDNVHKLRGALWMFNLAGIGLCAAGAAYLMDFAIRTVPSFSDPTSNLFIVEHRGVFVINAVVGAILGRNIMVGFDIVYDTIIYCYALELKRRKQEDDRAEESFREENRMLLWFMPAEEREEDSDPEQNHFLPARMKDAYSKMNNESSPQ